VAGLKELSGVWNNIKEVDLKPIRDSATHPVRIIMVGAQGSGRHTLAAQMRSDPARPEMKTQTSVVILTTEMAAELPPAHLTIVIVDAQSEDFSAEQILVKKWSEAGKNILVMINKIDLLEKAALANAQLDWMSSKVVYGSANNSASIQREFVPAVLELLPQQHLALGRQFPLFRLPIAHQLINDTCFSNAAYSFSTGVAEIVPVLDIPLNVTDMIILTKSQAFLAYKLGLLFGFTTRWQDYVTEFGGVIGGGFIWRQIARQLVGLIPVWGIIPKVAISYSGTYVVGNAILGWYLTGRHLTSKQMKALSAQAFGKGKDYAQKLAKKLPRSKRGKQRRDKLPAPAIMPELSQGEIIIIPDRGSSQLSPITEAGEIVLPGTAEQTIDAKNEAATQKALHQKRFHEKRKLLTLRKIKKAEVITEHRTCEKCGKISSGDASFCQYCGSALAVESTPQQI
jgi:uncharacterized protein (DUF697 family)